MRSSPEKYIALTFILIGIIAVSLHRDNALEISEKIEFYIWYITYPVFLIASINFHFRGIEKNKISYAFAGSSKFIKYPVYAFMSFFMAALGPAIILISVSVMIDIVAKEKYEISSRLDKISYNYGKGCKRTAYFIYENSKTASLCLDSYLFAKPISVQSPLRQRGSYILSGRKNGMGRVVDTIYEKI